MSQTAPQFLALSFKECPSCAKVNSIIADDNGSLAQRQSTVGTFSELQRRQDCEVCQFIVRKLSDDPASDAYQQQCPVVFWRWTVPKINLNQFSFGPIEGELNCLTCDLDHTTLTLLDSCSRDPESPYYVQLDPDWIDIDRVRSWADHCDVEHAGTCHGLTEWESIPKPAMAPLLLIDVISSCLVEILLVNKPKTQYIALSYVWGLLPDVLETTCEILPGLQIPNAFSSSSQWTARLPDTVRDAIELTRRLDLRYLWVDRLCIVQDDITGKNLQLEQMGAIYANAYLTLVAADGADANYGLRGSCPGVSQPRVFELPLLTFAQGGKSLILEPDIKSRRTRGEWHRRGWTFQERTLSHRNLVFQQGRVFWECRGAVWTEELAYGPRARSKPGSMKTAEMKKADILPLDAPRFRMKPTAYNISLGRWLDLYRWESLVTTYSELLFSFPSDGLRAFTGITNALSRSFRGGLLYGLPEYFFDYALLWMPYTPIRRRLPAGKIDSTLPSWSWVGWEGGAVNLSIMLHLRLEANVAFGLQIQEYTEIYPMVTWYKTDSRGVKKVVDNGYYEAVKLKNEKALPLPEGWTRVPFEESDEGEGFAHSELPGDVFVWPIHVPERPLQPCGGGFTPYLSLYTSRAFLYVSSRLYPVHESRFWSTAANAVVPQASMFHLRDNEENWVGMMYSNYFDNSGAANNEPCEFIVVSGGVTSKDSVGDHNGLEEWAQADEIKALAKYEFYNVLWIQWVSGIAYRKAVGRAWKPAWERLDRADIEVVLG
ncbi:heterokaryon incompatibility protein-domain-containing protein [Xylariaceae sp. FL1651]|nr:heterokaryon incompatibility protein-domain-containing protein [Xylariaceae sp. FL1651]